MKVDLKGRINNISLPLSKPLLPLFEAIINGIHAIEDAAIPNGQITIKISRDQRQENLALDDGRATNPILGFVVEDNGIGFTEAHYDSFQTSDSTLKIDRGAKGIGRFYWLKAFGRVEINSRYVQDGGTLQRSFAFDLVGDGIHGGTPVPCQINGSGTTVSLLDFFKQYEDACPKRASTIAEKIIEHCLVYFLNPRCPGLRLVDGQEAEALDLNKIFNETIKPYMRRSSYSINGHPFDLTHIRVYSGDPLQHSVHFCANNRDVQSEAVYKHIPHLKQKLDDGKGGRFVYVAYVSSPYLDQRVNAERTAFALPKDGELTQPGEITESTLVDQTIQQVKTELTVFLDAILDEAKQRVANLVANKYPEYRPILDRLVDYIDEIPVADDEDALVYKLNEIQLREDLKARQEGERLIEQADAASPDDTEYENRVREYVDRVTESSKSRLAQYVIHRKAILDLLRKRLEKGDTGRYRKEEEIHRLVFPMKTTSNEIKWESQNLWIIDERLVYHYFLSSDKPLKDVAALANTSTSRPDLLVLNRPSAFTDSDSEPLGSVVIIEFKRPERDDYDQSPIDQVYGYIKDILAGKAKTPQGRPVMVSPQTPFYGYVVCDLTDSIRQYAENASFKKTPDGLGYFGFNPNFNAYVEVISFNKLLQDASKRNHVLFEKLQLPHR
jgi:hypothetical protein